MQPKKTKLLDGSGKNKIKIGLGGCGLCVYRLS